MNVASSCNLQSVASERRGIGVKRCYLTNSVNCGALADVIRKAMRSFCVETTRDSEPQLSHVGQFLSSPDNERQLSYGSQRSPDQAGRLDRERGGRRPVSVGRAA